MQVVYHLGAHCTDEGRLLKSLLKNRDMLRQHGVILPNPSRYRKLIRHTIQSLEGGKPQQDTQEALLDAITDDDNVERLILSGEDFIAFAPWVFVRQALYGNANDRIAGLSNLFPNSEIEFHLGIRNPATFIPSVYARTGDLSFLDFMRGVTPQDVNWSTLIHTIRKTNPNAKLTVWCNEDTPLIWSQLMHGIIGITPKNPLDGETDLLSEIMSGEGMQRFVSYMKSHPSMTEMQKGKVITEFLEKYAIEDKLEEELDVPGWTQQLVEDLTDQYEEDLLEIAKIPGVNFITA